MKNKDLVLIILFFIFLAVTGFAVFSHYKQELTNPASTITQTLTIITPSPTISLVLGQRTQNSGCISINGLPDKSCTPGSIDPIVTQDNIQQTICVSGYSKTVRPSSYYTYKLKVKQIGEYGFTDTNTSNYEEDHLISLELGGSATDPANLWPEPGDSPNPKDKIENLCHQKVCSGQISLSKAQIQIASDWHIACQ